MVTIIMTKLLTKTHLNDVYTAVNKLDDIANGHELFHGDVAFNPHNNNLLFKQFTIWKLLLF